MKIAVVTPICQTPMSWLEQCLASVRVQTMSCSHFLIIDGDDALRDKTFPSVEVFYLPSRHSDYGNVARAIGSVSAAARDFDAIAYLDADNWLESDHVQILVELHMRTSASVCTSGRNIVDLLGCRLGACMEVDGEKFVDTSSIFLTRAAFGIIPVWYSVPQRLSAIGDRIVWKAIKDEKLSRAHNASPTVNFRSNYRAHYLAFGKEPPAGAKHVHVTMTSTGQYVSVETIADNASPAGYVTAVQPSLAAPLESSRKPARRRVSLCMIVKNEEANLPACLGPVADLFDEIIAVDTGSADGTKECARRLGAKVFDFAWVDSFAAARNESLRHATGDWIFWLDGDDRLDEANLTKLKHLLSDLSDDNNAYMMSQLSAPDRLLGTTLVVDQVRLFRNLPQARWSYRVHEQIFLALREQGAKEVRTDIAIHHLGYQDPEQKKAKYHRNVRLMQLELQENPRDPFVLFNLGNAYMDVGQVAEAVDFMKRCLEYAPARASYVPKVYFMLAGACQLLGRKDESLRYCLVGKKEFPHAAELWFHEGTLLLARNDLAGARHCFESILKLPKQGQYVGTDANLAGCRTHHNLAYIYWRMGLTQKAEEEWLCTITDYPQFEPAWLGIVELYLEQRRKPEAVRLLARLLGTPYCDLILPGLEARLLLAQEDLAGALKLLEEALLRTPEALWLRIFLSDILLRVADDDSAAESHLRAILEMAPNEQQTRRKLAQLVERRGNLVHETSHGMKHEES